MSCSSLASYLCSLNCFFCGYVICGISLVCLTTYTIVSTTLTTIGTIDGSTLPLIIFYALICMFSCSFLIPKVEAPPSSTLFFFLKTTLGEFVATIFLFSSVVCISSLVLLTLANAFYGFSF